MTVISDQLMARGAHIPGRGSFAASTRLEPAPRQFKLDCEPGSSASSFQTDRTYNKWELERHFTNMPAPTYLARSLTELIDLRASKSRGMLSLTAQDYSLMSLLFTQEPPNSGRSSKL